ncbi:phosphoglucosamine mutase [Wenzhouxiangella marina]|uniref:Phosphoglucosamine mutase n=1 Tax=Wenzhouxiangella marina TaxID=1579979 RepID=A0A0K0XWR3_9GAMM|nr:phosphoglucosamine mutase [Wenzhouxiangella marina]AKS42110.1 Phosphoglucosamine mutase [Wenzhouxiangella marina]MBB6086119.1 phosphoglucosamine mutase [Wenzhouxiangella marina]
MSHRYFGTDGIRGRVGDPPITVDFILHLGWAAGRVLAERSPGRPSVVIGKDTRISGYLFESALEAGFSAAGVDAVLLGPMPTPAIAHLTRSLGAVAGVVISASHNPYEDNGIKFFSGRGEKLDDEVQAAIEAQLDQPIEQVSAHRLGKATRVHDAVGRYIEYCKSTVPFGTRFDGLRMVVDCANGATYRIAPEVFRELGAEVVPIHDRPDGLNINADCGSTHPESLAERVVQERADLGIAFDGDGDRVLLVDHRGRLIDGDQILFLLARDRHSRGALEGGVVGTVMSNFGLEEAFRALEIPFERSPVGDRHVHEALRRNGWQLGGEASGHILCLDRAMTGCGIVSALQVLEVVARTRQSLAALAGGMERYPQVMINVPVQGQARVLVETHEGLALALSEAEASLGDQGRIILRPSGTEPVVRVTVEGRDSQQVQRLAESLARTVQEATQS